MCQRSDTVIDEEMLDMPERLVSGFIVVFLFKELRILGLGAPD